MKVTLIRHGIRLKHSDLHLIPCNAKTKLAWYWLEREHTYSRPRSRSISLYPLATISNFPAVLSFLPMRPENNSKSLKMAQVCVLHCSKNFVADMMSSNCVQPETLIHLHATLFVFGAHENLRAPRSEKRRIHQS
jgi:hypothetical protein